MMRDAETVIALRPKDSLGYALRAIAHRELGDLKKALSDHSRAIELCEVKSELLNLVDQRQETYWRSGDYRAALRDARRCVALAPDALAYRATLGKVHFRLKQYEAAKQEFARIRTGPGGLWQAVRTMTDYVFEMANAAEPLGIPDTLVNAWPFKLVTKYTDLHAQLERNATCLVQETFDLSSWSPDGRQLAYARSEFCGWNYAALKMVGTDSPLIARGIEILDLESGHTRVLTPSGGNPTWSPEGQYIAYVHSSDMTGGADAEVWLIPVDGGEPRRLAKGDYPHWTNHPTRLYFYSRSREAVCHIDVADPGAEPVHVAACPGWYAEVSPDEQYLAYATDGQLTVVALSSGETVAQWVVPGPERYCCVHWSPDGEEISISSLGLRDRCSGLWLYDIERKHGWHLFDSEAICCNWSRDRSRIVFDLFFPVSQIWTTQVDPNVPTWQALAPLQTRGEYIRSHWPRYVASYARAWSYRKPAVLANLRAVGLNQYAYGQYEDALWTLQEVAKMPEAHGAPLDVEAGAYAAIIQERLGHHHEARQSLRRLRAACENREIGDEHHLYEAEEALAPQGSAFSAIWDCIRSDQLDQASALFEALQVSSEDSVLDAEANRSIRSALARSYCRSADQARHVGQGLHQRITYYEAALRADPNCVPALRDVAWLLAVSPDPDLRDGMRALAHAQRACNLSEHEDSRCLAGLAAAYAEQGDFSAAVKWQQNAIKRIPKERSSHELTARLRSYESAEHIHCEKLGPLVAHWKFGQTDTRDEVHDSSGNGLHGKLAGDAQIVRDEDRGYVLSLDGEKDWVDCGNDVRFNTTDEMTLSAWVKTAIDGKWQAIVTKGESSWRLVAMNPLQFALKGVNASPSVSTNIEATYSVNDGRWHQIAAVYDGERMRLYVDGHMSASDKVRGSIAANTTRVRIGSNGQNPGCDWNGLIDDVHVYSYALTGPEIRTLYTEERSGMAER
jgi:tetratricopeptide (TPR) repeat protein